MSIKFHSISRDISMTLKVADLPNRDKVQLFRELLDQLGITSRLQEEPDATARAQEIFVEQWNKFWGSDY